MDKFKQIDPATSTIQASISSSSKRLLCFRKPAIVPPPRMPSLLGPVGGVGGGGILRPFRAAESKVKQFGRQNLFLIKILFFTDKF